MKPTIYIHAGTYKTASSSIQNFLYNNRERLIDLGWYYPSAGLHLSKQVGNRHYYLQQDLLRKEAYTYWKELVYELKENKAENIIISHENFLSPRIDPKDIIKLLPNYTIKMIVYFRHPVDYIESCYREWVRRVGQYDKDIQTFYQWRKQWLNYEKLIHKWDEAIGIENVMVRVFDKKCFREGSIEKDFLATIGLKGLDVVREKKNNESLNSRQILITLLQNRKLIDNSQFKSIESMLNDIFIHNDKDLRILDNKLVQEIIDTYDKDLKYIQNRANVDNNIESKYANLDHDLLFDIVKNGVLL